MRAMFWQRKNARLTARLNTLVENSERVSKSRRRKAPRVIIDQTYAQPHEPAETEQTEWQEHDDNAIAGYEPLVDDATWENDASCEGESQEAEWADEERVAGDESEESEEAAILHEAIDQLDQAEQREAAALAEIEKLRSQLDQEIAARQAGKQDEADKAASGQTENSAGSQRELDAARDEIEKLNAEIGVAVVARKAAEAARDKALEAAARKVDAEVEAKPDPAAQAREAEALAEAVALR